MEKGGVEAAACSVASLLPAFRNPTLATCARWATRLCFGMLLVPRFNDLEALIPILFGPTFTGDMVLLLQRIN